MLTLKVRVWAENAGVGVSQWAAETMGISQDKGGLTTQWIDNDVREHVWEIAQSMSIINEHGAGPEQWDLLIDRCITHISDLPSKRPLRKRYMADMTNLAGQNLKAALPEFSAVGLCWTKNCLDEILTKKRQLLHFGMYFIAPMVMLLFPMMGWYRRRRGRNLLSQVFTDKGALLHLDRFRCQAIQLYHSPCGSQHYWEKSGWKQYSAIHMALAWGWCIDTADGYINRRYNHVVNGEYCNCPSARQLPANPTAGGVPGGA